MVAAIVVVATAVWYGFNAGRTTWSGKSTMLAAYYPFYGAPDAALQMVETTVPSLGRREVLVEVAAASINPVGAHPCTPRSQMASAREVLLLLAHRRRFCTSQTTR